MEKPQRSHEPTNVFSVSDQVLSDKLHFIEEIGFGNWGSVWLCSPKKKQTSPTTDGLDKLHDSKIAVKLVHRSKTPTTAARVRSLWNEMKIVRAFKNDPHPSIIPFHSFIITPSYALITMAFLPTLIPVEVEESNVREWFHSLLSGVEFLHTRGVVHNDIKPANILLSHKNVPVLVDFGFAEKYDLRSSKAFHSNLSYGTPEYLSPERARGLPHDTRKSDVWSLGVTFFEILIGRTPFELSDTEQFTTKEELEKYWTRTLRGKWVGSWKMSKGMEKLLRRMIAPNADLRCTASDVMDDSYWHQRKDVNSHKKSASANSSLVLEDVSKLINMTAPWLHRSNKAKGNAQRPVDQDGPPKERRGSSPLTRIKFQSKTAASKSQSQPKKPFNAPALPTVKTSPPTPSHADKENTLLNDPKNAAAVRRRVSSRERLSHTVLKPLLHAVPPDVDPKEKGKHRKRALMDLTASNRNVENRGKENDRQRQGRSKGSVSQRMMEWEYEKERLRDLSLCEEREEAEREDAERTKQGKAKERNRLKAALRVTAVPMSTPSLSLHSDNPPRLDKDWQLSNFKNSLKASTDRTVQTSQLLMREPVAVQFSIDRMDESQTWQSERASWEDEGLIRDAKSSLPVVRHAIRNERLAADNRLDRMAIWMKNVEKVVEDARQNFASTSATPLPPLPVAPLSRSVSQTTGGRFSRPPPMALTASQIFAERAGPSSAGNADSMSPSTLENLCRVTTAIEHNLQTPPPRTRRATVSTQSPDPAHPERSLDEGTCSPSKHKEKYRSHGDLMQPISSLSILELELQKPAKPTPSPRLSEVLDRKLFITPPVVGREDADVPNLTLTPEKSSEVDELTSSPFIVEPYPPRKPGSQVPVPDTPTLKRVEVVYDRFLMTSGVKRNGRGYQSDNVGPVGNIPDSNVSHVKRNQWIPRSTRRAMPPPVSSADHGEPPVDEHGILNYRDGTPGDRDEGKTTVTFVRRAFMAIVNGKPAAR